MNDFWCEQHSRLVRIICHWKICQDVRCLWKSQRTGPTERWTRLLCIPSCETVIQEVAIDIDLPQTNSADYQQS